MSAVNGKAYSDEALRQAMRDNRGGEGKIDIFAKKGEAYQNFMVDHADGLRYPALEKITGEGVDREGGIDRLLQPKTR